MAKINIVFEDVGEDLDMKFEADPPLDLEKTDDWTPAQTAAYMMFNFLAQKIEDNNMEAEFTFEEGNSEESPE